MCTQIVGFIRVRFRVRVSIRVSLLYLVCASTLDNNVAPSAESMLIRTENCEIQRLISVCTDGYQALKIAKFSCKFPSLRTENSK